jgi:hypothetical protein
MMKGVTKADRNPVIMDIHYKTKYVDIKTKVRAKLVVVKDYFCPNEKCFNHTEKCSLNQLKAECNIKGKYICPACKLELKTEDKKIIKLYVVDNSSKTLIDLPKFLLSHTYFNFRKGKFEQITCFCKTIEEVNNGVDSSYKILNNPIMLTKNKKKRLISSCITYPITMEMLETKLERVKQLRVVEAI